MPKLNNPAADNGELSRFAVALGNEPLLALSLEVHLKDCISSKSHVHWRQIPSVQSSRECAQGCMDLRVACETRKQPL